MKMLNKFKKTNLSLYAIVALVYVTLLIDNILNTMIAPIMPAYFYNQRIKQSNEMTKEELSAITSPAPSTFPNNATMMEEQTTDSQNHSDGSKPLVQLIANIFVGPITDKIGFGIPLVVGYCIVVISSLAFAFGRTYWMLLLARSVQGIGSSCGSTAGMAMLANEFTNDDERGKMMSLALGGLAMGVIIGPTYGSVIYHYAGKETPFVILAVLSFLLLISLLCFKKIEIKSRVGEKSNILKTLTLLKDPYIALCLVLLGFGAIPIVVLEAGQPTWMIQTMCAAKWMLGVAFLPEDISYMIGIYFTGWCMTKVKRYLLSTTGLLMTGIGTIALPFAENFGELWAPGMLLGFGMGLISVSIYPTMGYLIDIRHRPVYGRVYGLADSAFCLSFILGDAITGLSIREIGYKYLVISTGVACVLAAPFALFLRNPPARSFEEEDHRALLEEESGNYESLKSYN